ncbi:GAF and ANTAR domain-containing protein [Arthrobacter sp. PsM3]|uniref:GAF and ANTAR domain-containing protein n=1 Tax=Arthrobacter sp. PsM3 TaxID=3030531 RepID=UPI00263B4D74|nr:GAF and ANTAR domain-containing protein [Arthrobacter sp. PsM3]MDN4644473.1 GAF and ANTAR domain-containing protein [Arthrobacter sp. PsM3]
MGDDADSMAEGLDAGLCTGFLESLPISGAAISVFSGLAPETMVCASDSVAAKVDELQFDLGEGPRWEALRTRRPVLLPNVRRGRHAAWPVFAKSLLELDVAALFVFPLALGALDIGVVELYSSESGPLSPAEQSTALQLADATTWRLLRQLLTLVPGDGADAPPDASPLSRREVHQATGMVLAQAGTTARDALLLMRAHAFAHGRTVREVARDVVGRSLDFTPGGG